MVRVPFLKCGAKVMHSDAMCMAQNIIIEWYYWNINFDYDVTVLSRFLLRIWLLLLQVFGISEDQIKWIWPQQHDYALFVCSALFWLVTFVHT